MVSKTTVIIDNNNDNDSSSNHNGSDGSNKNHYHNKFNHYHSLLTASCVLLFKFICFLFVSLVEMFCPKFEQESLKCCLLK